jgi:hypothetical protein
MRIVLAAAIVSALAAPGCHSSNQPRVASALAGLPEYTPEEAIAFDDTLAANIFGLKNEVEPSKDPNMSARVNQADWVGHARIATISKETLAGKDGYTLAVSPDGPALAGAQDGSSVELKIPRGGPAYLRLETTPEKLIGKRIILFLRKYADRGEVANHWHGEADDASVVSAIERQKALDAQSAQAQNKN